MAPNVLDSHMQFAFIKANFLAATTGVVFAQLITGLTNMQKIAWAVKRIEYSWSYQALDGMTGASNFTRFAITQSGSLLNLMPEYAPVVDLLDLTMLNTPAADNAKVLVYEPLVSDFGGEDKLIVPQNVFLGVSWSHNSAPEATQQVYARIWYREIELSSQDWYDLLQLRLPLGAS